MWADASNAGVYDNGQGGLQQSSVHPFALVQTAVKGEFMGIYFRNSNAMSPVIRYTDGGKAVLSYISTGGNIEIYFMQKASAKEIIASYQNIVGKPSLPPFWALGWHASSPLDTTQAKV